MKIANEDNDEDNEDKDKYKGYNRSDYNDADEELEDLSWSEIVRKNSNTFNNKVGCSFPTLRYLNVDDSSLPSLDKQKKEDIRRDTGGREDEEEKKGPPWSKIFGKSEKKKKLSEL